MKPWYKVITPRAAVTVGLSPSFAKWGFLRAPAVGGEARLDRERRGPELG
jgi:hypothetical protein